MDRIILHCDCNSFYASVECLYHPELRGKPVAVGGDEAQRHGIILTKTPEARQFGVQTGEAIWQAKQQCPKLIVVPAHYDLYMHHSKLAREVYGRYTDRVEAFGLDECWLDITGSTGLFGSGPTIAENIRQTIKRELGITVSIGVSWNKVFAKLGSDYKKPDAVTIISRENFREKFWPLPASDLLYVGPATAKKLARYGIHTIGELAGLEEPFLRRTFGKWGTYLWAFANGHDISPVLKAGHESPIKSVGNSMTTYRDIENLEEARQVLLHISESVAGRLRENGFRARTVELSVRDNRMEWCSCQGKLPAASCTSATLANEAMKLLKEKYRLTCPLRALGVRACDLISLDAGFQLSLVDDAKRQERQETIESCVDGLRRRFGWNIVRRASLVKADIVGEADPLTHSVHPVGFFGR